MNIAVRTDIARTAPQPADPLDHLADVLFHKMGTRRRLRPHRAL